MSNEGLKSFHAWIPVDLHIMLKKLSAETGISGTKIFVQYLKYLKKKHYKERETLNENSTEEFNFTEEHS